MKRVRTALVDDHKRAVEALKAIYNAIGFFESVHGAMSRDDMLASLKETSAALDNVRDLIYK